MKEDGKLGNKRLTSDLMIHERFTFQSHKKGHKSCRNARNKRVRLKLLFVKGFEHQHFTFIFFEIISEFPSLDEVNIPLTI